MQGFTGCLYRNFTSSDSELTEILIGMKAPQALNAAQSEGCWTDVNQGIGMTSLSSGSRPLISASQRFVLLLSGEIDNGQALLQELERNDSAPIHPLADQAAPTPQAIPDWNPTSDGQILLAAIEKFGVGGALTHCHGSFVFALWDRQDRLLYLARDRMGEWPLYFGWQDSVLLFGSSLKSIERHPDFQNTIDRQALTELIRFGFVPGPQSIYSNIHKLPAGCFIAIGTHRPSPDVVTYWSLADTAQRGQMKPFEGDASAALNEIERCLKDTLESLTSKHAPSGVFLSGSADSSLIGAILQSQNPNPMQTLSVRFEESIEPGQVSASTPPHVTQTTSHHELVIQDCHTDDLLRRLSNIIDEPSVCPTQIQSYFLSLLAEQHTRRVLNGAGGFILRGGGLNHDRLLKHWNRLRYFPLSLRRSLARLVTLIPPSAWDNAFHYLGFLLPGNIGYRSPGNALHHFSSLMTAQRPEDLYLDSISQTRDAKRLVLGGKDGTHMLNTPSRWPALRDAANRMLFLEAMTPLSDGALTVGQNFAQAMNLEQRSPFLDLRLIELAWRLPSNLKRHEGSNAPALDQILQRLQPTPSETPITPPEIPLDRWLRGPLRESAEALLQADRLKTEGYFHPKKVQQIWRAHLSGHRNHGALLWSLLMFQAWLESRRPS